MSSQEVVETKSPLLLHRVLRAILPHSRLEGFVLACSLVGLAFFRFPTASAGWIIDDIGGFGAGLRLAESAVLVALAALSYAFAFARRGKTFRFLVALKVVGLVVLVAERPPSLAATLAILSPLLLEIAIYEAFFLNIAASLLALAPLFAVQAFGLAGARYGGPAAVGGCYFFLGLLAFVACLLVRHRESLIDARERVSMLEKTISRLTQSNMSYQSYAQEASRKSQLEERMRITRELHDHIGYTFTNNIMMLEAAVSKISKDPKKVLELIALARENARTGLEKIRSALYRFRAHETRPTPSLHKFLELVRIFSVATNVGVRFDHGSFPSDIDEEHEHFFYHFIQQAMTNSFLHGGADAIEVRLQGTSRSLLAEVYDNGRGAEKIVEGIGIAGMRERLEHLGGQLRYANMERGFLIAAEIPRHGELADAAG